MSEMDGERAGQMMLRGIGVLAFGLASVASAQAPAAAHAQVMLSSGGLGLQGAAQGQLYREIDDPHSGDRWLLMRNDEFPGGPGRLVLAAAHRNSVDSAPGRAATETQEAQVLPVIRTGDRLIVEEHTAVVDAVLEARAMMPAMAGAAFDARLTIGGSVVRVVALGPGRATLQPWTGVRP
jgi:hypothetical protein